jgi:hypothetical protein
MPREKAPYTPREKASCCNLLHVLYLIKSIAMVGKQ